MLIVPADSEGDAIVLLSTIDEAKDDVSSLGSMN
jgi:hypothetical protein